MTINLPDPAMVAEFSKEQLQQIIETDHVQCGDATHWHYMTEPAAPKEVENN